MTNREASVTQDLGFGSRPPQGLADSTCRAERRTLCRRARLCGFGVSWGPPLGSPLSGVKVGGRQEGTWLGEHRGGPRPGRPLPALIQSGERDASSLGSGRVAQSGLRRVWRSFKLFGFIFKI